MVSALASRTAIHDGSNELRGDAAFDNTCASEHRCLRDLQKHRQHTAEVRRSRRTSSRWEDLDPVCQCLEVRGHFFELHECPQEPHEPSDVTLLCFTLVQHRGTASGPQGFFLRLAKAMESGAARTQRRKARLGSLETSVYETQESRKEEEQVQKSATDQFVVAATFAPGRYHARCLQGQGPTDRRPRKMQMKLLLAGILKGAQTPSLLRGQVVSRTTR